MRVAFREEESGGSERAISIEEVYLDALIYDELMPDSSDDAEELGDDFAEAGENKKSK